MDLEKEIGYCLVSQQIRERINSGKIVSKFDESRIQPSSFEPIIGNELFILDDVFRPQENETIYRTLLQLPGRRRQKVDTTNGFEMKKGFTYLIPLEERIVMAESEYIKSSPKSSLGRLFLNTRLLSDYNPCMDEVNSQYKVDTKLGLWLLVQSLAFNVIAYPGLTLNQLRFLKGYNVQLKSSEIIEEFEKNPLLYAKDERGKLNPIEKPIITEDGLQIHLNVLGQNTSGIIGLRARHNPEPIDLTKEEEYEAEEFFEPLKTDDGKFKIERNEYYLFASDEVLRIPQHLSVELRDHSHISLRGPLHFAGFVDNNFMGNLVFEIRSDELSDVDFIHRMPISKLDFFRTEIPDKLYGISIGSNYQKQTGPRLTKYFKKFDFGFAARNYEKLDRDVLIQDAEVLNKHRKTDKAFEFLCPDEVSELYKDIKNGFFQSRYDCEFDELILQPIPYVLIFGPDNTVFSYIRAKNIEDYGDERLFGKHSIGLGGHITLDDHEHTDFILRNIEREVMEEEVEIIGNFSKPYLIGTIMAYDKPVDRVHFGLIFSMHAQGEVKQKESSIYKGRMVSVEELMDDPACPEKYETWSRVLIPYLTEIIKK